MAVTSANLTGRRRPRPSRRPQEQLGASVAVYLDGGTAPGGPASTILDCTGDAPLTLREGALTRAEIDVALEEAEKREAEEAARAAAVAAAAAQPPRSRPGPADRRLAPPPAEPAPDRVPQQLSGPVAGTRITVRPGADSTEISPWWWSVMIRREMSRPSPVPWPTGLVVKNGSKTCFAVSALIPGPESSTSTTTQPSSSSRVRTRSVPWPSIASTALSMRLVHTWFSSAAIASIRGTSGL